MAQQFVQLNVGGVPHTTARETLMREPSSRLALMARGILPCPTGADGAMFIDRSPRFFQISERAPKKRPRVGCGGSPKGMFAPAEARPLLLPAQYPRNAAAPRNLCPPPTCCPKSSITCGTAGCCCPRRRTSAASCCRRSGARGLSLFRPGHTACTTAAAALQQAQQGEEGAAPA
jgi:hypothetical protein